MKKTVICTPMAPALTLSEESALSLLDSGNDIRILQGGYSALVLSSLTGEEWNRILRNYPQLLDITDDRGEAVFGIEFDNEGPGSVLDDRVVFGHVVTDDGYATATVLLQPETDTNPGQLLLDKLGTGLNRLAEVEQMALAVLYGPGKIPRNIRHRIVRL